MPTPDESFAHGEHNEQACNLLHTANSFPDWTITTAFYAALHFVTCKIFPFEYKVKDKAPLRFTDISAWQTFKNYTSNKRHELLNDLTAAHCPEIHDKYDWLLGTSYHARYHTHLHSKEIVNRAISYMGDIKKYCDPKKVAKKK